MSGTGPGLHGWRQYDTADPEAAHDFLSDRYVRLAVRAIDHRHDGFALHVRGVPVEQVALSRLQYLADARLRTAANADLLIVNVHEGLYEVAHDDQIDCVPPGEAVLVPPDRAVDVHQIDLDASVVNLPRELIEQVAEASTGASAHGLRFEGARPLSAELALYWQRAQAYVWQTVIADPSVADNPLIAGPAQRMLAAAAVAAFPNTALRGELARPGAVGPAVVRRAKAYIEQNAACDLTVTDIAAAAGVDPAALQVAFRQHEATTPTSYARRVRLERAHQELRTADPRDGMTVAAIAARWGFVNLGRFVASYRDEYGHPPSQTLRAGPRTVR